MQKLYQFDADSGRQEDEAIFIILREPHGPSLGDITIRYKFCLPTKTKNKRYSMLDGDAMFAAVIENIMERNNQR